jgi:hypothetical protein
VVPDDKIDESSTTPFLLIYSFNHSNRSDNSAKKPNPKI